MIRPVTSLAAPWRHPRFGPINGPLLLLLAALEERSDD